MKTPQPRMAFAPLLRTSRIAEGGGALITVHVPENNFGSGGPGFTYERPAINTILAELLGCSLRNVVRWQREGIPLSAAEDVAFRLGSHPAVIWGADWIFSAGCPLAKVVARQFPTGNSHPSTSVNPQAERESLTV